MDGPFKFCLGPLEIQMVGAPDPQQKMFTESSEKRYCPPLSSYRLLVYMGLCIFFFFFFAYHFFTWVLLKNLVLRTMHFGKTYSVQDIYTYLLLYSTGITNVIHSQLSFTQTKSAKTFWKALQHCATSYILYRKQEGGFHGHPIHTFTRIY